MGAAPVTGLALGSPPADAPGVPGLALPLLEPHRSSLETCVFCPKLCRGACPVSNAEASETVTPWGKMSVAYFEARGDVPLDREHAATAWACTSCFACRDFCEHKNPVASVLTEARAEAFARGVAPAAVARASERWSERARDAEHAMDVIATQTDTDRAGPSETALLVGCGYARWAPDVARDAVSAAAALTGGRVRPVRACCGLPMLHAGDVAQFVASAKRLAAEVAAAPRVVAVDPGCARTLLVEYARFGVRLPKVELFVDLAASSLQHLRQLSSAELADVLETASSSQLRQPSRGAESGAAASHAQHRQPNTAAENGTTTSPAQHRQPIAGAESGAAASRAQLRQPTKEADPDLAKAPSPQLRQPMSVRWHDPCQLGRGLGRYDEPRTVLERVAGNVGGFQREREAAECSGGGALLPITRPETSRAIAEARVAEHRRAGGGVLVTHCASSLQRFRTAGEAAVDLTTLVARALAARGAR
jgi:Fe-S oxidoreductase